MRYKMPLTRGHVTLASRVMLPVYPAFAAAVGASFLFTPLHRLLESPTLAYANKLVPLSLWGGGFLIVAGVLLLALLLGNRRVYQGALALMGVWMLIYTAVTLWSAFDGRASFSAWTWPAFVAAACWASMLSLEARER